MSIAASSGDHSRNLFATSAIASDRRADGSIILKSTAPLREGARCIGDWLEHWARQAPDRIFLADRAGADAPWATATYKDALQQVRSAAAWILSQGLSAERPLVILSDNSVEHALFALAAQHVGVPSAAISPAYSLISRDFDKLRSMITLLGPGVIYVSGTKPFAAALAAIQPLHSATIVSGDSLATPTRFCSAPSRRRRKRLTSPRPSQRSPRTPSQNSCSPRVRPARQRPSSTPSAC
jgi:feruloyl-CoA synthase